MCRSKSSIRNDTLELEFQESSTKVKQKGFNLYKIGLKHLDNKEPKFDILVYGLEKVCNTHQHYDGKMNQELLKWEIDIGENQISDSNIQILIRGTVSGILYLEKLFGHP